MEAVQSIVDTTFFCTNFPLRANEKTVLRDSLLDLLDKLLTYNDIVFVEGDEGIGKTCLVAQFAKRHYKNSASIFIDNLSAYSSDLTVVEKQIFSQIYYILHNDVPTTSDHFLVSSIISELSVWAKINETKVYFIIDGLDSLNDKQNVRESIVRMLPFGYNNISFVISATRRSFIPELSDVSYRCNCYSMHIPNFTISEAEEFFADHKEITKEHINKIFDSFKMPIQLKTIKRIISENNSIEINSFLSDMPENLSELFEYEWKRNGLENGLKVDLITILAHDIIMHTPIFLSRFFKVEIEELLSIISGITFLVCVDRSYISFSSETFKKFAADKTINLRNDLFQRLIEFLLLNREDDFTVEHLPSYYDRVGQYNDIIGYLTPEYFSTILSKSRSINALLVKSEMGIKASKESKNYHSLIRFNLQHSLITETGVNSVDKLELEALIALGEYEKARILADTCMLKEDRLKLLAVYLSRKKMKGLELEEEVLEEINNLHSTIDYKLLGEKAYEISTEMLLFRPDLAMSIIEEVTDTEEDENAIDKIYVQSKKVIKKDSDGNKEFLQNLSLRVSLLTNTLTPELLLQEIEKINKISEKMYFILRWLESKDDDVGIYSVVKTAIELIVSVHDYNATANIFARLSKSLVYINDPANRNELFDWFNSQKDFVMEQGPSSEYVDFLLGLFNIQLINCNYDRAIELLIEAYYYTSKIKDAIMRSECLAIIKSHLSLLNDIQKPTFQTITAEIENEFNELIKSLLSSTADQVNVFKGILSVLARNNLHDGIAIVEQINVLSRRDKAFSILINSHIDITNGKYDFDSILHILNNLIVDETEKNYCIERVTSFIQQTQKNSREILKFTEVVFAVRCCYYKCLSLVNLYTALPENTDNLKKQAKIGIFDAWENISILWDKISIGYTIVAILKDKDNEFANEIFNRTKQCVEHTIIYSSEIASNYVGCLRLCIRLMTTIMVEGLDNKDDFDDLENLISQLPSKGVQCELWSDFATRLGALGKIDKTKMIVENYVDPLYNSISDKDYCYKSKIKASIAPALFIAQPIATLDKISDLDIYLQDEALQNIAYYILTKTSVYEPVENYNYRGIFYTYDEITTLFTLIKSLKEDNRVYYLIKSVTDILVYNFSDLKLNRNQKNDICDRLIGLADSKFPAPHFISHEGYKLLSLAAIYRVQHKLNKPIDWTALFDKANAINNIADRVYVKIEICEHMNCVTNVPRSMLNVIRLDIQDIPSIHDKSSRYKYFGDFVWEIDKVVAKECYKNALLLTSDSNNTQLQKTQKDIIDTVYQLDKDYALSLVSLFDDDDEVKIKARQKVQHEIQLKKIRENLINPRKLNANIEKTSLEDFAQQAWSSLGLLNAKKIGPQGISDMKENIYRLTGMNLEQSFLILAWIIENICLVHGQSELCNTFIKPVYKYFVIESNLYTKMVGLRTRRIEEIMDSVLKDAEDKTITINIQEREKAKRFLETWLKDNIGDSIIVCDPYFKLDDLEIFTWINQYNHNCLVTVIASLLEHKKIFRDKNLEDYPESYNDYWRRNFFVQDMPSVELVLISNPDLGDKCPIHDRFWITNGRGLTFGTSYNSLGKDRMSTITRMSDKDAQRLSIELQNYMSRRKREVFGTRLISSSISLS